MTLTCPIVLSLGSSGPRGALAYFGVGHVFIWVVSKEIGHHYARREAHSGDEMVRKSQMWSSRSCFPIFLEGRGEKNGKLF